ncbi:hypothetical protein BV20DRAFT_69434 [Pilatotrama ljubarskyi]|nr:hypothetical protein BV20DRAFT_69434 [Pilatotrama ljubarskyi]
MRNARWTRFPSTKSTSVQICADHRDDLRDEQALVHDCCSQELVASQDSFRRPVRIAAVTRHRRSTSKRQQSDIERELPIDGSSDECPGTVYFVLMPSQNLVDECWMLIRQAHLAFVLNIAKHELRERRENALTKSRATSDHDGGGSQAAPSSDT